MRKRSPGCIVMVFGSLAAFAASLTVLIFHRRAAAGVLLLVPAAGAEADARFRAPVIPVLCNRGGAWLLPWQPASASAVARIACARGDGTVT